MRGEVSQKCVVGCAQKEVSNIHHQHCGLLLAFAIIYSSLRVLIAIEA
jgi:hypothetical protein